MPDYVTKITEKVIAIQNALEKCRPQVEVILTGVDAFQKGLIRFIEANHDAIDSFLKDLPSFGQREKEIWISAANFGWFINSETSITIRQAIKDGQEALDEFMVGHLEHDWSDIKTNILKANPKRVHILDCAFDLHEKGNYIAAIPLFLSQADGICLEYFGVNLFTHSKTRQKMVEERIGQDTDLSFTSAMLRLLITPTPISEPTFNSDFSELSLAPNRHGILHGLLEYVDYGNKQNSLKAFSLLAFVSFLFPENEEEAAGSGLKE